MRVCLRFLPLTLLLGACAGPLELFYKPGVSVSRMQTDHTNCEVRALRDAPVANQVRQRPPIFYPGYPVCDGAGNCFYRPGYWVDGGFYTVDVNRDLRNRVLGQCMAQRGYQPVSLPQCSQGLRSQITPQTTTTLPRLSESSCYVRNGDGSYQIVTPQIASKG